MRSALIILGTAVIATAVFASRPVDVGDQDPVVLTRQPPASPPILVFGDAMPQFGDLDVFTPLPAIAASVAPVAAAETPMTESRLRSITQAEIALMKAAGIGMDAQGFEISDDAGVQAADDTDASL